MSTSQHTHADLGRHLELWVDQELISRAEAEAIARFEQRGEVAPHRISLATEAIGYVGAALLLAAGATLASRFWNDADDLAHVTILAIVTALLIGLGWGFRASAEPAVGRLAGVVWVAGTATAAGLASVIAIDLANADGRVPQFAAGATATLVALPLYLLRRKTLQLLALFVGAAVMVGSLFAEPSTAGWAIWALSATWTVVAGTGRLPPERTAYVAGSLGMLIGAMMVADGGNAGLWLGIATSAALLSASVILHERVLLGFGAAGLFVYLLRTIGTYLGGGAGMAAGLAGAGLIVLLAALVPSRRTARRQAPS